MLNWIKSRLNLQSSGHQNLKKTFRALKNLPNESREEANKAYELLLEVDHSSSKETFDKLVNSISAISYASNTNGFFQFFFPPISHILYFRPEYTSKLLGRLIGPNFANGISDVQAMIDMITGAMHYQLSSNPYFLSKESQQWVNESLPKMQEEIKREIDICVQELND